MNLYLYQNYRIYKWLLQTNIFYCPFCVRDKIRAVDLYGDLQWRAPSANHFKSHTDLTRIFYRSCEMKQ